MSAGANSIDLDEALQILLPSAAKPHAATARLNTAIIDGEARLWANDTVVDPDFFVRHLRIGTKAVKGEWYAKLDPLATPVDGLTTTAWTMSRMEVTGLLGETKPSGRQRGRKQVFDWDALVAELVRRVHVDGIPASASDLGLATDLVKWCGEQNFTEIPEIETVRKKIAVWLSRYRQEN